MDADTVKISTQSPYFSKAHCCMEEVCWPVYVGRFTVTPQQFPLNIFSACHLAEMSSVVLETMQSFFVTSNLFD